MSRRLSSRLGQRSDYQVFVGVPLERPERWARAQNYTERSVTTQYGVHPLAAIRAWTIAYPFSNQLVDSEPGDLDIPPGLSALEETHSASDDEPDTFDPAEAQIGARLVRISFQPSDVYPDDKDHYQTTLTNIGSESFRVTKFGAFTWDGRHYQLSTIGARFFSAEEFQEWYGTPADGWIKSGESVTDPNNYGGRDAKWTYFCETPNGVRFLVGRAADEPRPVGDGLLARLRRALFGEPRGRG
ncbi:MAG: hypothetical protein R3B07_04605 [Polyangiaceae bacterium]